MEGGGRVKLFRSYFRRSVEIFLGFGVFMRIA